MANDDIESGAGRTPSKTALLAPDEVAVSTPPESTARAAVSEVAVRPPPESTSRSPGNGRAAERTAERYAAAERAAAERTAAASRDVMEGDPPLTESGQKDGQEPAIVKQGVLEILPEGWGFLRSSNYKI